MKLLSAKIPARCGLSLKKAQARETRGPSSFTFSHSQCRPPSLREAARESAAGGAVMVLRGLSGEDLGETASRISDVIGKNRSAGMDRPYSFRMLFDRGSAAARACLRPHAGSGLRGTVPRKGFGGRIASLRSRTHRKGGRKCRDVYQAP